MPFDGKRLIHGGFELMFDSGAQPFEEDGFCKAFDRGSAA